MTTTITKRRLTPAPKHAFQAVLALFISLLAIGASAANPAGALQYIPRTATSVVTVDVDKVRASSLFAQAKMFTELNEPGALKELNKFKKETGVDVLKDLHTAVFASGPDFPDDTDQFVAVLEGSFNEVQLMRALQKKASKKIRKRSTATLGSYYTIGRREQGAFAIRGRYIIIGGTKFFEQAMTKKGISPALKSQLALHNGRHLAAVLNVTPAVLRQIARKEPMLKDAKQLSVGINLSPGLDINAIATFANASTANKISKLLNTGLADAKRSREAKQFGVARYLHNVKVKSTGTKIKGTVKLSATDLKAIMRKVEKLL